MHHFSLSLVREFPIGFSWHLFYCKVCVESWGGIKLQQTKQRDSFAIQTWMSNPKLNLYYYFFPLICIPVLFFKYISFKFFYITDVYKCLSIWLTKEKKKKRLFDSKKKKKKKKKPIERHWNHSFLEIHVKKKEKKKV